MPESSASYSHAVLILTCDSDQRRFEALTRGLRHYWPEAQHVILRDTDRSTESDLPDRVRACVRKFVNLRRVFDLPLMSDAEWLCFVDTDCLFTDTPTELLEPCYQPALRYRDLPQWEEMWSGIGVQVPSGYPQLSGCLYTIRRQDLLDHREEAVRCVEYAISHSDFDPFCCYEGIVAGIWRRHYKNNPLDRMRYTQCRLERGMAMVHFGIRCNSPSPETLRGIDDLYLQYDKILSREETRNG